MGVPPKFCFLRFVAVRQPGRPAGPAASLQDSGRCASGDVQAAGGYQSGDGVPGSTLTPPKAAMRPCRSITICVASWRSSAASWLT